MIQYTEEKLSIHLIKTKKKKKQSLRLRRQITKPSQKLQDRQKIGLTEDIKLDLLTENDKMIWNRREKERLNTREGRAQRLKL